MAYDVSTLPGMKARGNGTTDTGEIWKRVGARAAFLEIAEWCRKQSEIERQQLNVNTAVGMRIVATECHKRAKALG